MIAICSNADKCDAICRHKEKHYSSGSCLIEPCANIDGIIGSKCMKYKEEPVIQKLEELADQTAKAKTALDTQIDGNHYTKLAIQPMEYSFKNNLNCLQHTIVKYITRYKDKGGLADLQKARHCIDMLIQLEYLEC